MPRSLLFVFLLLAGSASFAQKYDLLLRGGRVLDPANRVEGVQDVAIAGEKIAAIQASIPASEARQVVDVKGFYVTPGLVDIHAHVYGFSAWVPADAFALPSCVTTLVDAGGSGWKTFEEFKRTVMDTARTRVLALVNIVGRGMLGPEVENNVADMDPEATAGVVRRFPSLIVGIKTAHFNKPTWEAVDSAVRAGEIGHVPVMVDFWPMPERTYPDLILKHLRPGDIHTHFYGQRTPLLDENNKVQGYAREARKKGILFDVGHGAGSLWFRIAQPALAQGFLPDTISTDLHLRSLLCCKATMVTTLSKFLNMGMPLGEVIRRATVNPAKAIRRPELGTLSPGATADVAVLALEKGSFSFVDSGGARLRGAQNLECMLTVRAGKIAWDPQGLSRPDWQKAGKY